MRRQRVWWEERHDGLRRRRRLRWLTSHLPCAVLTGLWLHGMRIFSASNQFLSSNVGFLQHRYISNPASLPRVQFPPGEGGGGCISVHLLEGRGAAPTPSPCPGSRARAPGGMRGLGGRRGASDGGCWAGVGAEWRAEAPQLPSASPSFAWQPCSSGSMN